MATTGPRVTFSEALMRERARLQISRSEVADQCGVSVDVVKRWERGYATPATQQFKRLVAMMIRLAPHPPNWSRYEGAILSGEYEEHKADIAAELRHLEIKHGAAEQRPISEPFGIGLRRVRDENDVTQAELAEVLGLTDSAISMWETENSTPVQVNLDKLYTVLPELKAGVDTGAIKRPAARDMVVPGPTQGAPRRAATVDTMLEMALQQSDEEAARPRSERTKLKTEDFPDHEHRYENDVDYYGRTTSGKVCAICGEPEPKPEPKEPITRIVRGTGHGDHVRCGCGGALSQQGDLWICDQCRSLFKKLTTTGEIADAYTQARLKLLQAQAREKASHAELCEINERHGNDIKATIAARKEEAEALALLDLALSEET